MSFCFGCDRTLEYGSLPACVETEVKESIESNRIDVSSTAPQPLGHKPTNVYIFPRDGLPGHRQQRPDPPPVHSRPAPQKMNREKNAVGSLVSAFRHSG